MFIQTSSSCHASQSAYCNWRNTLLFLAFYNYACGGFLSVELCNRINALFRRLKKFGYFSHTIAVYELLQNAVRDLFYKMCYSKHSLHYLLRPRRNVTTCVPGATPLTYQIRAAIHTKVFYLAHVVWFYVFYVIPYFM